MERKLKLLKKSTSPYYITQNPVIFQNVKSKILYDVCCSSVDMTLSIIVI